MRTKPYEAKTLSGAQAYARRLEKRIERTDAFVERLDQERKQLAADCRTLAKLAADGPCLFNPLDVYAAKELRDNILRIECGLTPEGKIIHD